MIRSKTEIMKKLFILFLALCSLSSCMVIKSSASHEPVNVQPISALIADLDVSPDRITYTMKPHHRVQRGGFENVKSTAVREALQKSGGGDVLVGLEVQTRSRRLLIWTFVESITVSGYPAKYVDFKTPDDSYWSPLGVWLTQEAINNDKSSPNNTSTVMSVINGFKKFGRR